MRLRTYTVQGLYRLCVDCIDCFLVFSCLCLCVCCCCAVVSYCVMCVILSNSTEKIRVREQKI